MRINLTYPTDEQLKEHPNTLAKVSYEMGNRQFAINNVFIRKGMTVDEKTGEKLEKLFVAFPQQLTGKRTAEDTPERLDIITMKAKNEQTGYSIANEIKEATIKAYEELKEKAVPGKVTYKNVAFKNEKDEVDYKINVNLQGDDYKGTVYHNNKNQERKMLAKVNITVNDMFIVKGASYIQKKGEKGEIVDSLQFPTKTTTNITGDKVEKTDYQRYAFANGEQEYKKILGLVKDKYQEVLQKVENKIQASKKEEQTAKPTPAKPKAPKLSA